MATGYRFINILLAIVFLAVFSWCLTSVIKVNNLKESINMLEEQVDKLSKEKEILEEENKMLNARIEQEEAQEQIIISGCKMRYVITSDSNINDNLNYKMLQMAVDFIISLFKNDTEHLRTLCTEQFYNELMSTANASHESELSEAQKAYKRIDGKNLAGFSHITNASIYQDKYIVFIYFSSEDIEEILDGVITFSINENGEAFIENFGINK